VDEINDLLIYTPNPDFAGTDNFVYNGCADTDPDICGSATVIVTVNQIPDKPIANDDLYNTYINTPFNAEHLLNDIDIDDEGLEYFIIDDADNCATTAIGDEILYVEPIGDFLGTDEVTYAVCKIGSTVYCDTATITINVLSTNFNAPAAVNDTVEIYLDFSGVIYPLLNDFDGDGDNLTITEIITDGITGIASFNSDSVSYGALELGEDVFSYVVCDDNLPSLCDTAQIVVNVVTPPVGELVVHVPNSFSPNGDGINDLLEVEGLPELTRFNLKIYDRWSSLVYENVDQSKTWDGKSNVEFVSSSGDVPEGTYYYVLRINGFPDPMAGFIVVKR
jgi:gliding motility-associated-like protein